MMWINLYRRVRNAAHIITFTGFTWLASMDSLQAVQLTLMWEPSPAEQNIQAYSVYYGQSSRTYGASVTVDGSETRATLPDLTPGVTYYFAVTSRNAAGIESGYSAELAYTVPENPTGNQRPTLDPLSDVTVDEDSADYVISLDGISSGSSTEAQTLTLTAFSANTAVVANPTIDYTSPNTSGILTLKPVAGASGSSVITVMVDDGGTNNNTLLRTFNLIVQAVNDPPTLAALTNLSLTANSGKQTISLSGISTGAGNESDSLTVTATSSNPTLTGNPVVSYTSPSATGTLEFTPATNTTGLAVITVTVNDGQSLSNTISRSFEVLVTQSGSSVATMTNATISPYTAFRYVIPSPFEKDHRMTCTLNGDAPEGAKITSRKNVTAFSWTPTSAHASTTNLISIKIVDQQDPAASTNYVLQITVLDYLSVIPGVVALEAGKNALLPVYVHCSDGLTNVNFSLTWPSNRFGTPSFNVSLPSLFSATLQNYSTNLALSLRTQPGQTFAGSNLVGYVSFPVPASHPSAFVGISSRAISGTKPNSGKYVSLFDAWGETIVVRDMPLMRSGLSASGRILNVYGKVGVSYEVQSTTEGIIKPVWNPVTTYTHTNVSQTLSVSGSEPFIFYRLLQK